MIDPTIITLTKAALDNWLTGLGSTPLANNHIVLLLSEADTWLKKDLKPLITLAKQHSKKHQKTVAVVNKPLALEALEVELHIAPTLQEAIDLIELDEIERDLWK